MAYPDPPPEDFGTRLKRLARERGFSNKALAKETGAHVVTVSRWMAGTVPGTETLLVLTRLLRVNLDYLLCKEEKGRVYVKPHQLKTPKELEPAKGKRRKEGS